MVSGSQTMSENTIKADHLCVLVHGLWGNPSHLDYVASALRERHGEDRIHILCAKGNSGNFTYDGIELGGERLAHEIEETLDALATKNHKISKLSLVGYSLGGLVARYAIGLLHARGWLDKLEPVNFTTFASPHVGVRTPLKGLRDHIWNVLGARTVSTSGRQLFMIDSFRDTGRPLLSVLADPQSIFIQGLAKFQHRCVYANIVNDRSTVFYTTALSKVDPFRDLEEVNINYVKGYDRVIIDPDQYALPPATRQPETASSRAWKQFQALLFWVPLWILIILFVPLAATLFLLNAAVQTCRSRKRIRLHEEGKNGMLFGRYRVPLLVEDVRHAVEEVFENVNSRQEPAYLSSTEAESSDLTTEKATALGISEQIQLDERQTDTSLKTSDTLAGLEDSQHQLAPKLALNPAQFAIIDSLNSVGFRKYPVHIHKHRHSHAAIIVRMPKQGFGEGKIVMKHWLDKEFVV
ncbi:hypothetical protein NUU61_001155 [Penicillium alfredii]|uniref:DUF676 domain-containing protein n=1 Tax=Penicillium alfredii TaxID=1506179 RepID=A0A9W9KRP7_9EURO|nr:uncharacterized protein NUU61_001155 [Penicillium alfredii]KAJ5115396.1 hypothetical protein NUU61_001155 [Penicillium alfredii]